jgi:hypothetical protein
MFHWPLLLRLRTELSNVWRGAAFSLNLATAAQHQMRVFVFGCDGLSSKIDVVFLVWIDGG